MKRIYLAGPLTPKGNRADCKNGAVEYLRNVGDLLHAEKILRERGYAPFNPGRDLLSFLFLRPGESITEEQIKAESIVWLDVCDCALFLPGWRNSAGCWAEYRRCVEIGIPAYFSIEELQ